MKDGGKTVYSIRPEADPLKIADTNYEPAIDFAGKNLRQGIINNMEGL